MPNDYVTERLNLRHASIRNDLPPWIWLYELRPPGPVEALSCAAGGLEYARLMYAAANPETPFNDAHLFDTLISHGDTEAACAAALIGMNSVLEAGNDFREFNTWLIRIDSLITRPELSAHGRGALLIQTAIAQLLGPGQLDDTLVTLEALEDAAEAAGSDAQRIIHASLRGYCELMSGRLKVADAIVRDAAYISPEPEINLIPKIHLQASLGLINTIRNNLCDARECLNTLISSPAFDRLPSPLWLLSMGHRLLSLAVANDQPAELEAIADRIRAHSIPSHKHYHRSYTHYALGAAELLTSHPEAALFHAETAIQMAKRCYSAVAERTSSLLAIQALADLGQHEHALNWLAASVDGWNKAGAHLLTASGALEEAQLYLELGRPDLAHSALDRARAAIPTGETLPCNLRRPEFFTQLLARLNPPSKPATMPQLDPRPVQITTFSELCVEINGKRLYDRDWHGTRTKTLLKALIVLGGYKVSAERLCDLLWPDADGDVARNNLKVALWRLRHLGCKKSETPLPWVVIQHGYISLVAGLCRIDCIEFQHAFHEAETSQDTSQLSTLLLTIPANFLSNDDSEPWIIEHRETLLRTGLRAAYAVAEAAIHNSTIPDPSPILENFLRLAPADKRCKGLLKTLELNRM